jgi:uroporphyrinogen-III synthase
VLPAIGIILTRPLQQAQALARAIEAIGGRAIIFPALEIIPTKPDPADQAKIDAADMAIFISANAVEYGLQYAVVPRETLVAAIGAATAAALNQAGYQNVIVPPQGADSEALLAAPALHDVAGKHIAIFRGVGGRETLRDTLRQRGAKVEYIECYTRRRPDVAPDVISRLLARDDISAIQALSRETLENFCTMIGDKGVALLRHIGFQRGYPDGIRRCGLACGIGTTLRSTVNQ